MPRQGRINIEGGIYHVMQRGIERREIFKDDVDREEFLRRLGEGLKETIMKCYGWVLMPNHFHLLIRTGIKPLSDLMRKLLTGYALYFNRKYKRSGYLYQNRYKSILCQEESYLLELLRYIHLNPLRAKIVKDMEGLNNYKWSGHSVIIGKNKTQWQSIGEILESFGSRKGEAVSGYMRFISEAKDMGHSEQLAGGGLVRSVGGWKELLSLRESKQKQQGDERILGDGDFVEKVLSESEERMHRKEKIRRDGWEINRLIRYVCELTDVKEELVREKRKKKGIAQARGLISYWGLKELGLSGPELGQYLGVTKQAIAYLSKQGEKLVDEKRYVLSI